MPHDRSPANRSPIDTPPEPGLLLRLFDRAELAAAEPGGAWRVRLAGGKPVALLACLALAPRRTLTRERLVALLWPDSPEERGRHALRQQLSTLRRLLGAPLLRATDDAVTLGDALPDERTLLLQAARAGDHARVVALHAGPFLPGLEASGGCELEHWWDGERRQLWTLFAASATAEVARLVAAERGDEAVALATRVRDGAPDEEAGWRTLLAALVRTGRLVDARLEAGALTARLGDALSPETRALLQRVRTAAPASDGRSSRELPLIGREADMAWLLARWQRVRDGKATLLAVTAPAGLGKTRLLAALAERLRADGARVVTARALEGEGEADHALAAALALRLGRLPGAGGVAPASAGVLVGLAPSLSVDFAAAPGTNAAVDAPAVVHALTELVGSVADERPVALLVDDWQWADTASARTVAGVARRLGRARALVVLASRAPVALEGAAVEALTLAPLTTADVRALLAAGRPVALSGDRLPALLHAVSGGSPRWVLRLLRHGHAGRWLAPDVDGRPVGAGWPMAAARLLGAATAVRTASGVRELRRRVARAVAPEAVREGTVGLATVAVGILVLAWRARGDAPPPLGLLVPVTVPVATAAGHPPEAPLVVRVVDRDGHPRVTAGDSVRVTVVGGGRVVRGGSAPVVDGRARFTDLVLDGAQAVRLRLTAPGVRPLLTDSIYLGEEAALSSLRLVGGELAGTPLTGATVVRVTPGARLAGTLRVAYTSAWPNANIILATTPTWGDPSAGCRRIASLVTPVRDARRTVPIDERAPAQPGTYWLVVAFQAEDRASHVCSGTNWTYGDVVWGDGNDLAGWGAAQATAAARDGRVRNGFLSRHVDGTERRGSWNVVPAAMVRIEVVAAAR